MKHLEFKGKFAEKLLKGEKTSTIRKRVYVKPEELVYVHSGGKIIGKARIKNIRQISFSEIDDEIARKEGFSSADELLQELKQYYSQEENLYLIEFEFTPFETPVNPAELYYKNSDLMEIAKKALKSDGLNDKEKKVIELFLRTGSIRKTALRLGGLWKRGEVRDVLRKACTIINEQK
ncbi:ASCH domain-containing protein [Geoglobus acetivorans]|uniref:ASCH domain-containing protein n=1 Tax=Geoglobus acetivorans TaxID=565033 RepID=A0A0A7GCA2_GEOAI|nr:hypothetical protein GACE_0405 [Geoglobus acetivorans]